MDFRVIQTKWPGVTIIWVAMVPRRAWRNASQPGTVEKVRRKVNREFQVFLKKGLGHYLPHPLISSFDESIYHLDGVNLLDKGMDIFLSGL